jgi:hypothetical protein
MRTVIFNFRPEVEREKQDRILQKISSWSGVIKATRLKSDAKDPRVSRMSQVYIENSADAKGIVKKLSDTPEIEQASLPAERRLIRSNGR